MSTSSTPELRKLILIEKKYRSKEAYPNDSILKLCEAFLIALDTLESIRKCDCGHCAWQAQDELAKCEAAAKGDSNG